MTLYLVIAQDKDRDRDGKLKYRLSLREHVILQRPMMQSAAEPSQSACKRRAEMLFGPLEWRPASQLGLNNQPYINAVAVLDVNGGVW